MSNAFIAEHGPCAGPHGDDAQSGMDAGTEKASDVRADMRTVASCTAGGEKLGVERVVALWRAAELALSPIVGRRGTLAMLLRTLSLNRTGFGWLDIRGDTDDLEGAIASLRRAFSVRRPQEGDAAAQALSTSLGELLSSLLGPALATQLCGSPALAGALPRPGSRQGGDDTRSGTTPPRRDRARPAQRKRPHRGADFQRDLRIAEKNRSLFLLDARIAAARAELARLAGQGTGGERRIVSRHEARLVHANERLVLSAIDANEAADVAARLSQRDLLTGLPNRGLTLDRLEAAIATARRNGRMLGVLFVDLDGFKTVNDTRGHAAGDRTLQIAASRLASSVRESDTVGRFGGDEFLAILPDIEAAGDALFVAAKMVTTLSAPIGSTEDSPPVTASIGVAIYPDDAVTGADLIAFADQAMYRAKAHTRDRIGCHGAAVRDRPVSRATELVAHDPAGHGSHLRDANQRLVLAALGAQVDGPGTRIGKIRLERVAVSLRDVLDPVIAALHPAIAQRHQTLALQLQAAALTVHADPVRLGQVFANLLDNASRYSALGGKIALALSGDGHVASLQVTDDGIGITQEALPRIFDLFVQDTDARDDDGQGLGIGLAVARELVESHGGTIRASSAGRGRGSQFVVSLPMLSLQSGVTAGERPLG